jgi:hypothetical protein
VDILIIKNGFETLMDIVITNLDRYGATNVDDNNTTTMMTA